MLYKLNEYNQRFDFDQDLTIPLTDDMLKHMDFDRKKYVISFFTFALSQFYDSKSVIYRYRTQSTPAFYLDIFIEKANIGILFITDDDSYTAEEIESKQKICDIFGYKLYLIYLTSDKYKKNPYSEGNMLILNIPDNQDVQKTQGQAEQLLSAFFEAFLPRIAHMFEEAHAQLNMQLCYKLSMLYSMRAKEKKVMAAGRYI